MSFHVHNTYTGRKEAFAALEPGVVRMYNCGPTVYLRQHIGNFRAFLFAELLRRWLEYRGYEVRQVMNITDVGHLRDDEAADASGADKIEAQARASAEDPFEISARNTAEFLSDLRRLGVREAMVYPRATEHIPEMLEMIEGLLRSGHAYLAGENVYFDVSTFERYGQLSGNKVEDLEAGKRIAVLDEKRDAADFALWKSDPHHLMKWKSRFGSDGFPGWHIECSAMARKHLGDQIDIHTGGEDNIFPHHECEIAQSEAFLQKPFARYWMHTKFLQVDGGKMSKSLGNVYTLDDVEERGYDLRALRFCLLRGHYGTPLNFTWEILDDAVSALRKLDDLVQTLRAQVAEAQSDALGGEEALALVARERAAFEAGMDDDLNVPRALGALFSLRNQVVQHGLDPAAAAEALEFLLAANEVLGVIRTEAGDLDAEVQSLIDARQTARAEKNWGEADRIRDELAERGIELEDSPEGVVWRRR
jgi:cysteinyl-tRNA synthetase